MCYSPVYLCACVCHRHHEEEQGPMCRRSGEDIFTLFRHFAILDHEKSKQKTFFPQVHSFDGSAEDAAAIIDLDLYIGINGW